MSWSELERLVRDGERPGLVRRQLRGCRDDADLLLRARCLGYRITRVDLQRALLQHQQQRLGGSGGGAAARPMARQGAQG